MRNSAKTQDLVDEKKTWLFTDTECNIDKNISFQQNQLFQAFLTKDYHVFLQDDLCKELSKENYKNISMSRIYRVATKPLILLCCDVVE